MKKRIYSQEVLETVLRLADLTVVKEFEACMEYQYVILRNLPCRYIQCDEIWSFCYAKEKNVPEQYKSKFGFGDVWTWVAIDAETKLVPSWSVGLRDASYAQAFMDA